MLCGSRLIDGFVKNRGHRSNTIRVREWLGSSMQLRKHQVTLLPCEIEALAIAAAINHFAPHIIQSPHTTEVRTDSRPCLQA